MATSSQKVIATVTFKNWYQILFPLLSGNFIAAKIISFFPQYILVYLQVHSYSAWHINRYVLSFIYLDELRQSGVVSVVEYNSRVDGQKRALK